VRDQNGQLMPSAAVTWSVTPAGVLTLMPSGATVTLTASAVGTATVAATSGAVSGAAAVTVTSPAVPTISSFSPTIGAAGTSVVISGANFDPIAANDQLTLNTRPNLSVTAATASSLTATIPAATGSGRFRLTTPLGTALSANDFFVPPSPYTAADVQFADRTAVGGNKVVAIGTANKIGLVTFDGTAGQRVSLNAGNVTITSGSLELLKPDNASLASVGFTNLGRFMDVQVLPVTGTYTVLIDPNSSYIGSLTTTLYDVPPDVTGIIVPNGSNVPVTVTTPGQNVRLTFSGISGQRISLKASASTISSGTLAVVNPDGTTLTSVGLTSTGGFIDAVTLPMTGTYTVLANPTAATTGGATLTLYDVTSDVTGTIVPGGSSAIVSLTAPGQNARLTFNGTIGQRVSLRATSSTISSGILRILRPDGTTLVSTVLTASGAFIDVQSLAATGAYTVLVDPDTTNIGNTTLTLYDVPVDQSGTLTIGGTAAVALGTPGQNAAFTFSGTASQQVTVRVTGNTFGTTTVKLLKPDGSHLTSLMSGAASFNLSTQTLLTTGTYTIIVDPSGAGTGGMSLTVTSP
jgi:hypothetical protein